MSAIAVETAYQIANRKEVFTVKNPDDFKKDEQDKLFKMMHILDMLCTEVCKDNEFSSEDLDKVHAAQNMLFAHWITYSPLDLRSPEELMRYTVFKLNINPTSDKKGQ